MQYHPFGRVVPTVLPPVEGVFAFNVQTNVDTLLAGRYAQNPLPSRARLDVLARFSLPVVR